jgi:chaperonin GroES
MKFEPTGGNVVLKGLDPDEMTTGGVIMPDIDDDSCQKGEVVAVGPGPLLQGGTRGNMQTKVGDIVYYPRFSGKKLEVSREEFVVVREDEILTIYKGDNNG